MLFILSDFYRPRKGMLDSCMKVQIRKNQFMKPKELKLFAGMDAQLLQRQVHLEMTNMPLIFNYTRLENL